MNIDLHTILAPLATDVGWMVLLLDCIRKIYHPEESGKKD